MEKIRLVIADDHALFRKGLQQALGEIEGLTVVGEAADGHQAVQLAMELQPDLIIMDINMPGMDGITAIKHLREAGVETRVLVLTAYDDDQALLEVMSVGACGYVLKDVNMTELAEAIRACARGEGYLNPVMAAKVLARMSNNLGGAEAEGGDQNGDAASKGLTPREFEVLEQIALGASNRSIAERLYISESTVKNHVTSIFRKLAVEDRTQAVLYALKKGWVEV